MGFFNVYLVSLSLVIVILSLYISFNLLWRIRFTYQLVNKHLLLISSALIFGVALTLLHILFILSLETPINAGYYIVTFFTLFLIIFISAFISFNLLQSNLHSILSVSMSGLILGVGMIILPCLLKEPRYSMSYILCMIMVLISSQLAVRILKKVILTPYNVFSFRILISSLIIVLTSYITQYLGAPSIQLPSERDGIQLSQLLFLLSALDMFVIFLIITALYLIMTTLQYNRTYSKHIRSETFYHSIITALSEGLIIYSKYGNPVLVNDSAARIFEKSIEQIKETRLDQQIGAMSLGNEIPLSLEEHPVITTLNTGRAQHNLVVKLALQNNVEKWLKINTEPVKDINGHIESIIMSFADITNLKRQEININAVVENLQSGLLLLDKDNNVLLTNACLYKLFNITNITKENNPINNENLLMYLMHYIDINRLTKKLSEKGFNHFVTEQIHSNDGRFFEITYVKLRVGNNQSGTLININEITERKKLESFILNAKDEAAKVNKTDFLIKMGHELRSPLNSILGYSQLLLDRETIKNKDMLKRMQQSAKYLNSLVNRLLEVKETDKNKVVFQQEKFELGETIDEVISDLKPIAQINNVSISTKEFNNWKNVELISDPTKLKQILINLVTNGIKYNKEVGNVWINVRDTDHYIFIKVIDSGIGIRDHEIARIFDPFYRSPVVVNKNIYGIGIGLPIVKQLTESMGGEVLVKSTFGKGSCFTIKLPKK